MENENVVLNAENNLETQPVNNDVQNSTSSIEKNEKKKKTKIIIGIVALVIVLICLICFFIYNNFFTPAKFIDKNVKNLTALVNNTFDTTKKFANYDLLKEDVKDKGSITITSKSGDLKAFNNLKLEYDASMSLKNEYIASDITLSQNNAKMALKTYLDQNNIYIDSADIYSEVLKYGTEDNIFNILKESFNENNLTVDEIQSLSVKLIEYYGIALKEANMSSKLKGTTIEYQYVINKESYEKINKKLNELIKNDETFKKILSEYEETKDNSLDISIPEDFNEKKINVTVNILKNRIEKLNISSKDMTFIDAKLVKGNTYEVNIANMGIVKMEVEKGRINATIYDLTNKELGSYNVTYNDNEIKMDAESNTDEKTKFSLSLEGLKSNNIKVVGKLQATDMSLDINSNMKLNGNKLESSGVVSIVYAKNDLSINFNNTQEHGKDLISKKAINNTKDLSTMNETEMQTIENNIANKLQGFDFYKELSEMFSNESTVTVEPDYKDFQTFNNNVNSFSDMDDFSDFDDLDF